MLRDTADMSLLVELVIRTMVDYASLESLVGGFRKCASQRLDDEFLR